MFAFSIVAFAQGTTTITVSKSSPAIGDSVTVTVSGTESGSITVKYTSSMLTFSSCNVSGYTAEGNSVTFSGKEGDIVFNASAAGTASIIVSSTANSGSSTTLSIGGSGASTSTSNASTNETTTDTTTTDTTAENTTADDAADEAEETSEEVTTEETGNTATPAGVAGTLNSDGGFDINGTAYVVSERYSDSEMPSGFSKTTIKIGSSTYSEPTNGTITLLYLKPADNTSGSGTFYIYDADAATVSEFLMLGSKDNYVIISTSASAPSSAFTSTSLDVTGGTATAYTLDGSEFFYVYGTNAEGTTGWYVYDKTYETISRMDESTLSLTSVNDTTDEDDDAGQTSSDNNIYIEKLSLYRKIIMGLIILCVVLLFILINKAIRGGGEDDDFDGDVFAKAPVKSSRRMPRSIVFNSREVEDEEDDFDEDEEYYDEEEDFDDYEDDDADASRARYESESYEARRASSLNMMDLNDL